MPGDERSGPSSMVVLGVALGLATALVFGGALAWVFGMKARDDARKGFNLVPVIVAAVDLPAGDPVSIETISQRSMPEQFVTSSVVRPDSASAIIERPQHLDLRAGDLLLWSAFAATRDDLACWDMVKRVAAARTEPPSDALAQLLDSLRRPK